MHQALYRKWRPQVFDDVCGQEHITSILKYEASIGKFNHAYLFCGSRGTGKTTCAKILAKAVNCENPKDGSPCGECASCRAIDEGATTDILEMDAASNNGVDNIRDIRDEVSYPPSLLKYRVYIVDEVHMLSDGAFNALLKTLEEPPSYVIFILATTELHKLPATIISRCQRFEFRRIAVDTLVSRLAYIAERENINVKHEALQLIAKIAQGGMRDAISILDLCAGGRRDSLIDEDAVNEIVGLSGRGVLTKVVTAVADKNFDAILEEIDNIVKSSKDISVFWQNLMSFYRDMLVYRSSKNAVKYLDLTDSEIKGLAEISSRFSRETILAHCKQIENAYFAMQKSNSVKRTVAELTLVKMCDDTLEASNENLLSRLSKLEDTVALGTISFSGSTAKKETVTEEKKAEPTEVRSEPVKEAPKPAPQPETQKIKGLSCWAEVVDRVSQSDSRSASYLRLTKAYVLGDGSIKVYVPDSFTMMMIDGSGAKDSLRAALSVCLKREIPDAKLSFEEKKNELPDDDESALDSIIENFGI